MNPGDPIHAGKVPAILVVDDIASNIDVLLEILSPDYEVRVSMDGESALEDVADEAPDLILLDIMMPGMDGYEVCRRLKSDEKTRDIPVIFVTARVEIDDEIKGFDTGAVDYITKPVSPPVVKARVASHLALKQARQDLERQNRILTENARLRETVERISRHDLKTPLNKIVSIPRILLGDARTPAWQAPHLKAVEAAGYTVLDMVNRSLDLLKMEKGTYELKAAAVDLANIVFKIMSDLDGAAGEKKIRFLPDISGKRAGQGDRFWVSGENLLCYSMAANLIKNAVEACPKEGRIQISMQGDSDGRAILAIRNPGQVPEEIRLRFFEKYATGGKAGGTGLGTYSARLMARTMGGDISMATHAVDGTTLCVTLPAARPGSPAGTRETGTWETGTREADNTGFETREFPGLDILIADDDPDNLNILATFLAHPRIRLHRAGNGLEALELWRAGKGRLAFMDMEMPEMNGLEAVRRIRAEEAGIPSLQEPAVIVALSGHDDDKTCSACVKAGFDAYLVKPVARAVLQQTVLDFLAARDKCDDDASGYTVSVDGDLEEIMPAFLENKQAQIREAAALAAEADFKSLGHLGHKLKGGFNMYGMAVLGEVCARLEQAAADRDLPGVLTSAKDLEERFSRLDIIYE